MAWMTAFNWLPFVASVEFSSTLPAARLVKVRFNSGLPLFGSAFAPMLHVELAEPPATGYEILDILIVDVDIAGDVLLPEPNAILLSSDADAIAPIEIPAIPDALDSEPIAKLLVIAAKLAIPIAIDEIPAEELSLPMEILRSPDAVHMEPSDVLASPAALHWRPSAIADSLDAIL